MQQTSLSPFLTSPVQPGRAGVEKPGGPADGRDEFFTEFSRQEEKPPVSTAPDGPESKARLGTDAEAREHDPVEEDAQVADAAPQGPVPVEGLPQGRSLGNTPSAPDNGTEGAPPVAARPTSDGDGPVAAGQGGGASGLALFTPAGGSSIPAASLRRQDQPPGLTLAGGSAAPPAGQPPALEPGQSHAFTGPLTPGHPLRPDAAATPPIAHPVTQPPAPAGTLPPVADAQAMGTAVAVGPPVAPPQGLRARPGEVVQPGAAASTAPAAGTPASDAPPGEGRGLRHAAHILPPTAATPEAATPAAAALQRPLPVHVAQLQPRPDIPAALAEMADFAETTGDTEARFDLRTDTRLQATAPLRADALFHRPDIPRAVAQQLAEAAQKLQDARVEVSLNPAELGRVRMSLSSGEGGLMVSITAERGETLDLMRRNIAALAQEFRDIGHDSVSFSFGQQPGGQAGRQDAPPPDGAHGPSGDLPPPAAPQAIHLTLSAPTGLDIRL